MADTNDAFRAGFEAFNEEGNYCNPYLSYHKHNAFIHGWNEARRAKRREQKAIHQLSTAPKAEASAAEAVSPLRPVFAWFVRDVRTGGVIAGFLTERDAADFWGEFCSCDYEVTEI